MEKASTILALIFGFATALFSLTAFGFANLDLAYPALIAFGFFILFANLAQPRPVKITR